MAGPAASRPKSRLMGLIFISFTTHLLTGKRMKDNAIPTTTLRESPVLRIPGYRYSGGEYPTTRGNPYPGTCTRGMINYPEYRGLPL
eukprot:116365-Rhodomonas_salina.1